MTIKKPICVIKNNTENTDSITTEYESDYDSDYDESDYSSSGGGNDKYKYKSLIDTNYVKPTNGTIQDNLTKDDILQKLKGYKALRSNDDKRILLTLKPFTVWIRYFNTKTNSFRVGGLLKMVDPELRFIMLVNTSKNLTWSVQLKDCIIFIPKNIEIKTKTKLKEQTTKNKLYELYKQGKLGRRE